MDPMFTTAFIPGQLSLMEMLALIDEPARQSCRTFIRVHLMRLTDAPGSKSAHQAWPGGYIAHITDAMNLAIQIYNTLSAWGPLPFTLSDVLLVLFWHDVEKPWRYVEPTDPEACGDKEARGRFRARIFKEFNVVFTPEQANALKYVEGEGKDYTPGARVMNELGGLCHACDVLSARTRHSKALMYGLEST